MKPLQTKESEKTTEKYLKDQVLRLGGLSYKWVSPNNSGVPDRICFFNASLIVLVEIKSEGLKPSPLQAHVFSRLSELGHPVFVVDTKTAVDQLMKTIGERLNELSRD